MATYIESAKNLEKARDIFAKYLTDQQDYAKIRIIGPCDYLETKIDDEHAYLVIATNDTVGP